MKKKGFTLIEVIATMAISVIVIMAMGSLFVSYNKVNIDMQNTTINENYYNIAKAQIINLAYNKNLIAPEEKEIVNSSGQVVKIQLIEKDGNEMNILAKVDNKYYIYKNIKIQDGRIEQYTEENLLENVDNINIKWNSKNINSNLVQVDVTIKIKNTVKKYEFSLLKA